jgi:putative DNA primase/helicase
MDNITHNSLHNSAAQFIEAMKLAGLAPPTHLELDKMMRFTGKGKGRANKAAWCKLFADGSGGVYGDYSSGLNTSWHAAREAPVQPLTEAQRDAYKQQLAAAQTANAAHEAAKHAQAARVAAKIWNKAITAPPNHPYLLRKGIHTHGARIHKSALLIPVREGATLHSLQFIDGDGTKRFLTGGRKRGCYYSIGKPEGAAALCIAEGFATGATIRQATGHLVAVAFDAGNLEAVALTLREKFPALPIILCADDDPVGLSHARAAARAVNGRVAVPQFVRSISDNSVGDNTMSDRTDFNDLAAEYGIDVVAQTISAALSADSTTHYNASHYSADYAAANSLMSMHDDEGAMTTVPQIIALDIDALLQRDFPPMEALLSPWLCKQHLSMIYAWRGVGKTHFALGVAYAVAGGGQFLKWKADKPRRVVYIDGEMAGAAIQARLAAIVASSPDEHEPPQDFLKVITPDAQLLPLPDLASREGQAALQPVIADADLIVVDNISSLMRAGTENEGESWVPVANWALAMRKQGKAVLFVHHAGKGGQQRGSSRREDLMDVVIKLDHAKDYEAAKGAAFVVAFEKSRHLSGEDAKDIEAALVENHAGVQSWEWKDADVSRGERIAELHRENPELSQTDIATELGVSRATVSRALKKAKQDGRGRL